LANTFGIDITFIGDGDDFQGDRIQCPQDIKAFPSSRRFDEQAGKAPEIP